MAEASNVPVPAPIVARHRRPGAAPRLETGHGIIGDDVIFVDPAGAYALISTQADG